jgi:hypothetical protein
MAGKPEPPHPRTGAEFYEALPAFAEYRRAELVGMLQEVKDLADAYGSLVARATLVLGSSAPRSVRDTVFRDLMADVFDFLYEWPRPLFEGRLHVAYPLARRAYESLSLMSLCYQHEDAAKRWHDGAQISNAEVRKALSTAPMSESKEALDGLYRFFSKAAHPNRDLVAERRLGIGNEFVLGSIGRPNLVLIVDHCMHLIDMWFWFGALVAFASKEILHQADRTFGRDYLKTAARARQLQKSLASNFNRLVAEAQAETRTARR